jgi:hypothetical protein
MRTSHYRPSLETLGQRSMPSATVPLHPNPAAHGADLGHSLIPLSPHGRVAPDAGTHAARIEYVPSQLWGAHVGADESLGGSAQRTVDVEVVVLGVLGTGAVNMQPERDELFGNMPRFWAVSLGR